MTPLCVVHTESSLGWGGQEIRILSESQGFIRRGHDVKLICPPESRIFSEAPAWGVPAIGLPIARKRLKGVSALLDWFRANRCEVVSTHSSTDSWLAALTMLMLGRPCPIVRTRHISAPLGRGALTRWLYTRATARIVTTGEALKSQLVERNGFPAGRIDSVPTGVDASRFRPGDKAAARAALGLPQDKAIVGIVATLRSWKGHRYLVEALAGLPENVELLIVGDGPQRETLEAQIEKHALGSRVRLAGNQRDVVPWLQALDVFALPSYANEGVPQALLQAMLVGLPCVTTGAGAIPELARHGTTALVVAPQEVAPLRAALHQVLVDPSLGEKLGRAARSHCEARFSHQRMLDDMERVYRQARGQKVQSVQSGA